MKVWSAREAEYLEGRRFGANYDKVIRARIKRKINDMLLATGFAFEGLNGVEKLGDGTLLGRISTHEDAVYRVLRKRQTESQMRLAHLLGELLADRKKRR